MICLPPRHNCTCKALGGILSIWRMSLIAHVLAPSRERRHPCAPPHFLPPCHPGTCVSASPFSQPPPQPGLDFPMLTIHVVALSHPLDFPVKRRKMSNASAGSSCPHSTWPWLETVVAITVLFCVRTVVLLVPRCCPLL